MPLLGKKKSKKTYASERTAILGSETKKSKKLKRSKQAFKTSTSFNAPVESFHIPPVQRNSVPCLGKENSRARPLSVIVPKSPRMVPDDDADAKQHTFNRDVFMSRLGSAPEITKRTRSVSSLVRHRRQQSKSCQDFKDSADFTKFLEEELGIRTVSEQSVEADFDLHEANPQTWMHFAKSISPTESPALSPKLSNEHIGDAVSGALFNSSPASFPDNEKTASAEVPFDPFAESATEASTVHTHRRQRSKSVSTLSTQLSDDLSRLQLSDRADSLPSANPFADVTPRSGRIGSDQNELYNPFFEE